MKTKKASGRPCARALGTEIRDLLHSHNQANIEYAAQQIECASRRNGGSLAGTARDIGVTATTLKRWMFLFPIVQNAMKEGDSRLTPPLNLARAAERLGRFLARCERDPILACRELNIKPGLLAQWCDEPLKNGYLPGSQDVP